MDAQRTEMTTRDGVRVTRTAAPFDPAELGRVAALADERRGGVMSSGMEYPGRYSRWHMAYIDPCAEIVAVGEGRDPAERGRIERRVGAGDPHPVAGRHLDTLGVHSGPSVSGPGGGRATKKRPPFLGGRFYRNANQHAA